METMNLGPVGREADYGLTDAQIETLVSAGVIPEKTPPAQIRLFANVCKELRLSPFTKDIYLLSHFSKALNRAIYSPVIGIGGFRKIAAETGQLAGIDDAKFDIQPDGAFKTAAQLVTENKWPISATVTVYRVVSGMKAEFSHTCLLREFDTAQQKWASMKFQMLFKTAESHALRKAFGDRIPASVIDESEVGAFVGETAADKSLADAKKPLLAKIIGAPAMSLPDPGEVPEESPAESETAPAVDPKIATAIEWAEFQGFDPESPDEMNAIMSALKEIGMRPPSERPFALMPAYNAMTERFTKAGWLFNNDTGKVYPSPERIAAQQKAADQ